MAACAVFPLLLLLAKFQLSLPANPLTSTFTPSIIVFCCVTKQLCQWGKRWSIRVYCFWPMEESSVAEVGGFPG